MPHLNRSIYAHKDGLGSKDSVARIVGNVVLQSHVPEAVDPRLCPSHGAIRESLLLPELSVVCLVPEVALRALICLDVILVAARRSTLP